MKRYPTLEELTFTEAELLQQLDDLYHALEAEDHPRPIYVGAMVRVAPDLLPLPSQLMEDLTRKDGMDMDPAAAAALLWLLSIDLVPDGG